mmetsp:Transcript_109094/g.314235  ORF Transcript_109094/g.314235 Transcript_109094/m.314235 type:complete len:305 (+) Transcript_109094:471-1385(+)
MPHFGAGPARPRSELFQLVPGLRGGAPIRRRWRAPTVEAEALLAGGGCGGRDAEGPLIFEALRREEVQALAGAIALGDIGADGCGGRRRRIQRRKPGIFRREMHPRGPMRRRLLRRAPRILGGEVHLRNPGRGRVQRPRVLYGARRRRKSALVREDCGADRRKLLGGRRRRFRQWRGNVRANIRRAQRIEGGTCGERQRRHENGRRGAGPSPDMRHPARRRRGGRLAHASRGLGVGGGGDRPCETGSAGGSKGLMLQVERGHIRRGRRRRHRPDAGRREGRRGRGGRCSRSGEARRHRGRALRG